MTTLTYLNTSRTTLGKAGVYYYLNNTLKFTGPWTYAGYGELKTGDPLHIYKRITGHDNTANVYVPFHIVLGDIPVDIQLVAGETNDGSPIFKE